MKVQAIYASLLFTLGALAPAAATSRVAATDSVEILEPYVVTLETNSFGRHDTQRIVALSELTARCDDADGCRLRILAFLWDGGNGQFRVENMNTFALWTQNGGIKWFRYDDQGEPSGGYIGRSGSTLNQDHEVIVSSRAGVDLDCSLVDANPISDGYSYALVAIWNPQYNDPLACLLRIDD